MLKDLEQIDSNMIQTVYEYNKLNLEEQKQTTREVIQEHRTGGIDPTATGRPNRNKGKKNRQ